MTVDWVKALAAYGKAWNERDRQARMDLLRDALADDARYTDSEFDVSAVDGVSSRAAAAVFAMEQRLL